MRISRFIHIINDKEVWDAINKQFIKVDTQDISYIIKNKYKPNLIKYPKNLEKLGIIVDSETEDKYIKELADSITDRQFQSLYLITTTNCNLDCDYCFYRSSSSESLKHRENMSFEVAKEAIDKFKKVVARNKVTPHYWQQITFYGGEPLLNKKMLLEAIPYVRKKFNDNTSVVVNTNLTILDSEMISLFKNNNVEVQVSLDGNKQSHDLHRKTHTGQGSYDIVIHNMKILIENGVKILPMITATDSNVKDLSKILLEIIDELGISDFAVNILISGSYDVNNLYIETLVKEMLKAYREFGNRANDYVFVDLYEKLLAKDKSIARNSCGATRKITVFPSGEIYACQALEKVDINKIGKLSDDFVDNSKWDLWRKRNRFYNNICLGCEVVASCGGGCATGSYNNGSSIYAIDTNQCKYTKELFKQLVKEIKR
jgi:uncharacterized protein